MPDDEAAHIFVDGATGYLGSHLVYRLVKEGFTVKCLVHQGSNRQDAETLRKFGAQVFIGTLDASDEFSPAVLKAFQGAALAVHLIGSVAPKKGENLNELHGKQTEWFLHHAHKGGVHRVISVTTLGADKDAASRYQQTKWNGEEKIRQSGLPYTILRPSLLYGRQVGKRDSKLVRRYREMIEEKAVVPLINGGKSRVQPLYIGDMVAALVRCIAQGLMRKEFAKRELELGGLEVVTMRQFVEMLMDAMGKRKPLIGVPPQLASLVAFGCEMTQQVPTVSRDQVLLSMRDNVCSENALTSVLGIEPTPLKQGLESYSPGFNVATGAAG